VWQVSGSSFLFTFHGSAQLGKEKEKEEIRRAATVPFY
jgi:hypothetical protein